MPGPWEFWDTSVYFGICGGGGSGPEPGYILSDPIQFFVLATPPRAEVCSKNCVNDPINPALGNVYTTETDVTFAGSGGIAFQRFYNSADASGTDGVPGWRHSYDRYVSTVYQTAAPNYPGPGPTVSPEYSTPALACTSGFAAIQGAVSSWAGATATYSDNICVISNGSTTISTLPVQVYPTPLPPPTVIEYDVIRDDGQILRYPIMGGTVTNPPGVSIRLAVTGSGFTVTDDQDTVETYNAAGVLQSITSRAGVVQTLSYTSGVWSGVNDSFGNSLSVARNTNGTIASVSVRGGGTVYYSYDSSNRLSGVTNLDSTTRSYAYGDATYPFALTGVIDENSVTYSSWTYDLQERGVTSQLAGGANSATLVYNSNSVQVTDGLGAIRTFSYSRLGDLNKVTGISGSQCPTCEESAATTYDAYGWVSSRTDYNGNLTCYANDPVRGLELVRVEGFAPGSTCPGTLSSYTPASGTLQRKITTAWSPTWREPQTITEPNRTTSFTFDGYGNVLTKTVTDTSVTPNVSRTWTYQYFNSGLYGQVQTATGPRTDITTDVTNYTYYNCASGGECGQIDTVENGLNQIWTFTSYNSYGQPLTMTDPNGVLTTLTYDLRERLTSSEVGSETTSYSYWPTGLVKLVTLPDSSTILFSYDNAHRLNTITDGLGNYIQYTLDALGNHTADNVYDSTGTLRLTHTRQFNSLSQLAKDINAANTSYVTTTFDYDAQGNLLNVFAPMSRETQESYDALNRLSQITDPNQGITVLGYDANDNLASVEDPRTFTTSYLHDGFNEVTQIGSPDTGTTVKTYDSAGNLKTVKDARGALATYSYDALNRLTEAAYADQTIYYTYDQGTNGLGRLTGAYDANHSMSWSYDPNGRVNGKGQTVGSVTKSVGYNYTNADLTTLVTPSGQTVTYGYTNHQIASISINGTTLLNGVTYFPFGAVSGWSWGNGTSDSRSYDTDGKISVLTTVSDPIDFTYDYAFRITRINDTGLSTARWSLNYDLLDRLTSATAGSVTDGWTYDANGNRLTQTGTSASTFTPSTTSNELNTATGTLARTYAYDTAGNTKSYSNLVFTYNDRGRMSGVTVGGVASSYVYNAVGQLIKKTVGSVTTLIVYDEAGHLLGEYSGSGALIQETIWMGDIPVATLRPNGTSVSIYYVHTDQLNAPRKISRPADNDLMWRWDTDPFGTIAPNQYPQGQGTFVYNLRFPGQYYQAETGLNYNYLRDYDPQTGRYIESDPIGLRGGSYSTYSYAGNNPISNKDPLGLMCTPGVGCYTTPAEAAAAQSGNYLGYYQLACAGGDAYACFAEHIAANDNDWGHLATDRLRDALRKKGCDNEDTLNDIRSDLANAYANYLPSDPANAIWPNAGDIAQFHWDVFGQYGLPPSTFGGSPLGTWGGLFLPGTWCPNCGGPRPPFAGMH